MTTRHPVRGAVVPLFLLSCLLLGGSTRSAWPNMALQIGAIALLAWAALGRPQAHSGVPGRNLALLCAAMVVLVFLQLVPLPPPLWSALPGREGVVRGFELLGQPLPWMPLSLTPYATMASALWLLPPLAIIAAILRLGAYREIGLTIALALAALGGVLLGAMQVTSADVLNSPWYFYAVTNNGKATGFFANSNHMATLLIVTIPFLFALLGARRGGQRYVHQEAGRYAILGGALMVLLVGIALNPSTAGVGLGIVVVAASLLIQMPRGARWGLVGLAAIVLLGLAAVAATFMTPLQSGIAVASADSSIATRAISIGNSLRIAADMFPAGSGSGSFPFVYPAYENPDIVDRWYVNHVHNDYVELALETGLLGILLMLLFLLWWTGRLVALWQAPHIDPFARAASIASGAILAHSLVDFPLRTSAIAAVFAMCIALMAGPRRRVRQEQLTRDGDGVRHLSID